MAASMPPMLIVIRALQDDAIVITARLETLQFPGSVHHGKDIHRFQLRSPDAVVVFDAYVEVTVVPAAVQQDSIVAPALGRIGVREEDALRVFGQRVRPAQAIAANSHVENVQAVRRAFAVGQQLLDVRQIEAFKAKLKAEQAGDGIEEPAGTRGRPSVRKR